MNGYQNYHPPGCRGCPLDETGKGFVLGCGTPEKARYAIILEAPGKEEVTFEIKPNPNRQFLQDAGSCEKEMAVRRRDYPNFDERYLRVGLPVVGPAGGALMWWIWPKTGIKREECYIDNTIRCLPPRSKSGTQYPTGEVKKAAELHCRQYDRISAFKPDTILFSLHPAGLLREITPLPLVVKDFEKVRDFTSQGRRVLALLGGKATAAFARYGANCSRWRGHYQALAADWSETYKSLFAHRKKERKKRLTGTVEDDIFGVPTIVRRKIADRQIRPDVLAAGPCKRAKVHTYKRPPTCCHTDCWDNYQRRQNEIQS